MNLKLACRRLVKTPLVSSVAILSLAPMLMGAVIVELSRCVGVFVPQEDFADHRAEPGKMRASDLIAECTNSPAAALAAKRPARMEWNAW
jgi:hypothetical protein